MKTQLRMIRGDITSVDADAIVNSANNEAFVYVATETDLSAAVLDQLNAGAPIDVVKPSATGTNTP